VWEAFLAAGTGELYFTVKNNKKNVMLWSTGEYCWMAFFPQMKSCNLKEE